jgi:hypothetical protein
MQKCERYERIPSGGRNRVVSRRFGGAARTFENCYNKVGKLVSHLLNDMLTSRLSWGYPGSMLLLDGTLVSMSSPAESSLPIWLIKDATNTLICAGWHDHGKELQDSWGRLCKLRTDRDERYALHFWPCWTGAHKWIALYQELSVLDRALTPLILLCMIIGVLIGVYVSGVQEAFDTIRLNDVSVRMCLYLPL